MTRILFTLLFACLLAACGGSGPAVADQDSEALPPEIPADTGTGVKGSEIIAASMRKEAFEQLKLYCAVQKGYWQSNHKFAPDFNFLGYPKVVMYEGSVVNLQLEVIFGTAEDFLMRATAANDVDGDSINGVWEVTKTCDPKEINSD